MNEKDVLIPEFSITGGQSTFRYRWLMLHQPVVVLVSLRSSVCSWSVWQARLSHPLNLTLWNLQTSCRGTTFHNVPTNTLRVPQCSWCSPVGTYPLPHAFLHFPALRGRQRRVGVRASAFWQRCRIRRPLCDGRTGWASRRHPAPPAGFGHSSELLFLASGLRYVTRWIC